MHTSRLARSCSRSCAILGSILDFETVRVSSRSNATTRRVSSIVLFRLRRYVGYQSEDPAPRQPDDSTEWGPGRASPVPLPLAKASAMLEKTTWWIREAAASR